MTLSDSKAPRRWLSSLLGTALFLLCGQVLGQTGDGRPVEPQAPEGWQSDAAEPSPAHEAADRLPSIAEGAASEEEASEDDVPAERPAAERPAAARSEPDYHFEFRRGGGRPLPWPSHYRKFGVADGVVSGAFGAAAMTAAIIGPKQQGLYGGWGFDEDVRDALRAQEYQGRLVARDISDVLLALGVVQAFMVDPLVNATWLRSSPKVGAQIALLNLEVAAITIGTQQVFANAVSRERPYVRICGTEELDERTFDCTGDDRNRSHFSGHTSTTFAIAAATCTHHQFLPLSGQKPWIACATGFTAAASTGLLRIIGDKHYATDVLVGAAFGSLIGWGVPFLHYKTKTPPLSGQVGRVTFGFMPTVGGVSVWGIMP